MIASHSCAKLLFLVSLLQSRMPFSFRSDPMRSFFFETLLQVVFLQFLAFDENLHLIVDVRPLLDIPFNSILASQRPERDL